MAYQFHYIFCATPFGCEAELKAFQETMAEFNREEAMPKGILFASLVIVPALADKRPYQGSVTENIRMCRYYVQVLEDGWGPPQRDYERDWALARRCAADPELPMREAVVFFKAPLLPHKVDPSIAELKQSLLTDGSPHFQFDTLPRFREELRATLTRWLGGVFEESTSEQVTASVPCP